MLTPDNPPQAVTQLLDLYDELPEAVKLVYDQNDSYQKIIHDLSNITSDTAPLVLAVKQNEDFATRLDEISAKVGSLPNFLSEWQGPGAHAFQLASSNACEDLIHLGKLSLEARSVLDSAITAFTAGEKLIVSLVETSLRYSVDSYTQANLLASETLGASLSAWTSTNLVQANRLAKLVKENTEKIEQLLDRLTDLLTDITDLTQLVTNRFSETL